MPSLKPNTDRMAVASRGRTTTETSPERTKVWTEPKPRIADGKVPVVYYLCRNGHLEHPHFMEVPISTEGLFLRDVINRLNFLRGKGMASMYSWSSKRSYKNGYVWHDLSEDDFIQPAHGREYVLKGSELLLPASSPASQDTASATEHVEQDSNFPTAGARKKMPWKSFDLNEYKVYKTDITVDAAVNAAADAATQTDDRRIRRRAPIIVDDERGDGLEEDNPTTELGRDEMSPPPPSSSSPETVEALTSAEERVTPIQPQDPNFVVGNYPSGRMRASAVLMHLISCGSISMKEGHHHHEGLSPVPQHHRRRLPRQASELSGLSEKPSFPAVGMEDRDYFSGSLIETKKKAADGVAELPGLKRSSSYNADRSSKLGMAAKEVESGRVKGIPRKPKPTPTPRKEAKLISSRTHGSKRINEEALQVCHKTEEHQRNVDVAEALPC